MDATQQVLEVLQAAPEFVNPAISLAAEVMQLEAKGHKDDVDRLLRSLEVERAIVAGESEGVAVQKSLASCGHSPPSPSKTVPVGF